MANNIDFTIQSGGISDRMSLTAMTGLNNPSSLSERAKQRAEKTSGNQVETISNMMNDELEYLLSNSKVMNEMQQSVDAANNVIQLLKTSLIVCKQTSSIAANMTSLCATRPDGFCVPAVNESLSISSASLKAKLESAYLDARQQITDYYNAILCTNCDSTLDNVVNTILNILDTIEPLLDPYVEQYTGYTYAELMQMCAKGVLLMNMLKRVSRTDAEVDMEHGDMSKEETEDMLKTWLKSQSVILLNGFYLLTFKTMISDIRLQCQKLGNSDANSFEAFVNRLNTVFSFFEILGIKQDSIGITLDDLKKIGQSVVGNASNTLLNINVDIATAVNVQQLGTFNTSNGMASTFRYNGQQNGKGKNIDVSVTLFDEPDTTEISLLLETLFTFSNVQIFPMGSKRAIVKNIQDIWKKGTKGNFVQIGRAGNVNRNYNFIIDIDKTLKQSLQTNVNANVDTSDLTGLERSLLSVSVGVELDDEAITSILEGKVMMFDPIVLMLKIFAPVIEVLKILNHLIDNYYTNKATVARKAHKDLSLTLKNAYQFGMGLHDMLSLKNKNFYAVRTLKLSDWCIKSFGDKVNKDGLMLISIPQTMKLNTYLSTHYSLNRKNGNGNNALNILKPTVLYFDTTSIENIDNTMEDGSMIGLDNICINSELEELYYDSRHRSTITSEIMRARSLNENVDGRPEFADLGEDKGVIDNFIEAITVVTDEIDGLQSINIADMNLCSPETQEIIDTEDNNDNEDNEDNEDNDVAPYAIIEFGDEYTKGERVDYTLNVKPGQSIDKDTVIGTVTINGVTKPILSLFDGGTVKATADGKHFQHLYSKSCSRHIIIENILPGQGCVYDAEYVQQFGTKFSASTSMYSFILCNLVYSGLPSIMINRHKSRTNSYTSFSNFQAFTKKAEKLVKSYQDYFETAGGEKGIKGCKGNPLKMEQLGNELLTTRQLMLEDIIQLYEKELPTVSCEGDFRFTDSIGLAYRHNGHLEDLKVGEDIIYNNYYYVLLSRINMTDGNIYAQRYFELLSDIITKRISSEDYSLYQLVEDFNKLLYNNGITKIKYKDLFNIFKGTEYKCEDIEYYLKQEYMRTYFNNKCMYDYVKDLDALTELSDKNNWVNTNIYNIDENLIDKMVSCCKQLAVMFMYIIKTSPNELPVLGTTEHVIQERLAKVQESLNILLEIYVFPSKDLVVKDGLSMDKATMCVERWVYIVSNDIQPDYSFRPMSEELPNLYVIVDALDNFFCYTKEEYDRKVFYQWLCDIAHEEIEEVLFLRILELTLFMSAHRNMTKQLLEAISTSTKRYTVDDIVDETMAFKLVKEENARLQKFWSEAIRAYRQEYNLFDTLDEFNEYALQFDKYAEWPIPNELNIKGKYYEHYLFYNYNTDAEEEPEEEITLPEVPDDLTEPEEGVVDENMICDIDMPDVKTISIFDYKYWLVYFANATLTTLIPLFWSDGFDVPPFMVPVILPAVYVPVCKPIYIKPIGVLIVFGIAIRGIWPAPIILTINLTHGDINAMTPVMIALNVTKKLFQALQTKIANGIPKLCLDMLNKTINDNATSRKALDKYRTYSSLLKSIGIDNEASIEKEFQKALAEYNGETDYDMRQVIVRTDKLDSGPELL